MTASGAGVVKADGAPVVGDSGPAADLLAGRVAELSYELAAARAAAAAAAAEHQLELECLHAEVVRVERALVIVQESLSWRLTRPVRTVGRLLRGRTG